MRATAKFIRHSDARRRDIVQAQVIIFTSDTDIAVAAPVFMSSLNSYSSNLDKQLDEAERIGRCFITMLQSKKTIERDPKS